MADLIVGDWNTKCSECGEYADASEKRHDTMLPGWPMVRPEAEQGCGAVFTGLRSSITARIAPSQAPCGMVGQMRPDLPYLGVEGG